MHAAAEHGTERHTQTHSHHTCIRSHTNTHSNAHADAHHGRGRREPDVHVHGADVVLDVDSLVEVGGLVFDVDLVLLLLLLEGR